MSRGKKWVMLKPFDGPPKRSDMKIQEFDIPELKDGDVLLETVVLSVDPYMRLWSERLKIGDSMMGETIGKVIKSKDPNLKIGDHVASQSGWVTHFVVPGKDTLKIPAIPKGVSPSVALGALGMPGLTAYIGLVDVSELKPTDTVYVNAAAGTVGSLVGQIAKLKGCKVIGCAGSDEKVKYLKTELGFDGAYNYKTVTPDLLDNELKTLAPNGIDVFWENVGGEASSVVYSHMNKNGRVLICGTISNYNADVKPKVTEFVHNLIYNTVRIQGFIVFQHYDKRDETLKTLAGLIKGGKIKYKEHVHNGFDSMFYAFMDIFSGKHIGKIVVTV